MPIKPIIQSFNKIDDANEQSVLAILAHLIPTLSQWRSGSDLKLQISEVEQKLLSLETEDESLKNKRDTADLAFSSVYKDYKSGPAISLYGGLTLLLVGWFVSGWLIALGISAAAYGAWALAQKKKALSEALNEAEAALGQNTSAIDSCRSDIQNLKAMLLEREDAFPEVTHARLGFPVAAQNILGKTTLIDQSGIFPDTSLTTIDLSEIHSNLKTLSDRIEAIRDVPVLLSPNVSDQEDDAIDVLHGEENILQDLVGDFTSTLAQVRDVELSLPLIPNSSAVAQAACADILATLDDDTVVMVGGQAGDTKSIDTFVAQVNLTRQSGTKVLRELKESFDQLQDICDSYANARANSMNDVHAQLFEVLNRASWCSKRFYCPRSILSPSYIEDVIEVQPLHAHKLDFDTLMNNLRRDATIASRIQTRPELCDELYAHYSAIGEIAGDIEFDEAGEPIDIGDRPSYLVDQFEESLARFRRTLSVLITGSVHPVLTLSKEARMYYDSDTEEWSSDTVPYRYSTADMLRYGQIPKVTSDLMVPLWEHLWTEKADFRKSELFRTNESILRMTEKESEKLIEVGNQFKADMRTVRENVYLLESDLKSKFDELIAFRDGMNSLGLLSDRQRAFLTDEKLKQISLGDESVLAEAEDYELLLGMEPKAQAERRGTVNDPIELVRAPESLISYVLEPVRRLAMR
jgi:hypothetical protein